MTNVSRLAPGDYEPAHDSLSVAEAQWRFLQAVRDVAPEVLRDLAGDPYAKHCAWLTYTMNHEVDWGDLTSVQAFDELATASVVALSEWQARWRLQPGWVRRVAEETLDQWRQRRIGILPTELVPLDDWVPLTLNHWNALAGPAAHLSPVPYLFVARHPDALRPLEGPVPFPPIGWHPTLESRAEARARMIAAATTAIDGYLERCDERLAGQRLTRVVRKTENEHFEWLVRYQVLNESYQSIARGAYRSGYTTARDAIKSVAKLIGFDGYLREPSKGGRPRIHPAAR